MNNIKLIMCDIDGTLLNSNHIITPKTIEAISKLKEHNILFGIATGRTPVGVVDSVEGWGIKDYCDIIMGFNGGMYYDYVTGNIGSAYPIDGKSIAKITEEYAKFPVYFGIYDGHEMHATGDSMYAKRHAIGNKLSFHVNDLQHYKETQAAKLLACGPKEVIDEVEAYYHEHLDPNYRAVRSTPELFEFLNPQLSKTKGIEIIAKNHGFTLENICVFGDEKNDLEMIRDCGIGVCMANGNPLVKEVANYITDSNDEDGIANFIYQYILKD